MNAILSLPPASPVAARRVLLVRHTSVAVRWTNRCYGRMDIGLSREGRRVAGKLAATLAQEPVTAIVHSGLKRTSYLASWLAMIKGISPVIDTRWRERDFGPWEGLSWQAIYRDTGDSMDGMFTAPDEYRPGGGGETTAEMAQRAVAAWHALPRDGVIVVVTHGGPIAAVRTMLANAPMTRIVDYTVHTGSIVSVPEGSPNDR